MARSKAARLLSRSYEITLRGWFVVNGLKRIAKAEDKRAQLEKEKLFFALHQKARQRREAAARMIDEAADVYGPLLGWYAILDERTTADCRTRHGKNFRAKKKPRGGYPSQIHLNCRCSPGAPWPQGQLIR